MKTFTTYIHALVDGEIRLFEGPPAYGNNDAEAKMYCQRNGLGYCEIGEEIVEERFWQLKHELN